MNNSIACRIVCLAIVLVIFVWAPQPALASGGHGGGGFHGGGGGFHGGGGGFHGGSNFGGAYHGGGYGWHGGGNAWHGGRYYGGWRGGYWGFPGWGYGGWGFSIGFNFGPFWGGYPYGYAWAPPYYYPYYYYPYPYYGPTAYTSADAYPNNGTTGNDYNGDYRLSPPGQQSAAPIPRPAPATNSLTIRDAAYRPAGPNHPTTITAASDNRHINSSARRLPATRPEVQNVIRALRAMPPAARQREIDSGRYGNLTPQELEFAKYAAGLQPPPASSAVLLTGTN